jgi:hypothetical protein
MKIGSLIRCMAFAVGCLFLSGLAGSARAATVDEYYRAGLSLYQQGKYEMAVKYFDAALKGDPKHWQSLQARGHCYYRMDRKPEALDSYVESLKLHPDTSLESFVTKLKGELGSGTPPPPSMPKPNGSGEIDQDIFINPAGLIFGTAGIGYEHTVGERGSMAGMFSFASHSFTGQKITMVGGGARYRFWGESDRRLKGLFVGPALGVLSIKWSFDSMTIDPYTWQMTSISDTQSALFFTVGAEGGYQWVFDNQVLIALGLSLNYMAGGFDEKPGWPAF